MEIEQIDVENQRLEPPQKAAEPAEASGKTGLRRKHPNRNCRKAESKSLTCQQPLNSGMKPIQDVMEYWSVTNRCDTSPDIDPIPDLTADGFAGIKNQYKNCQNEVAVTLYLLDRMGHEWPLSGAHDIDAPSTIWQFLSKYNRYGLIQ